MFKKFSFYFVALLSAVLFSGCAKDEPEEEEVIELFAENYTADSSSKLAVQDANTYWVDGDTMWVNGGAYWIKITNPDGSSAKAYTDDRHWRVFKPKYICAIYPFSAYVGDPPTTSTNKKNFEVRVPDTYNYKESGSASGSKQILDGLPMVAYGATYNDSKQYIDALNFKHLTAAITVRVKNLITGGSITLEKIELINNKYQLSGDMMVTFSDGDPGIKTVEGSHAIPYNNNGTSNNMVTLNFPDKYKITGEYKDFQIPILPVGDDPSTFTIKVYYKAVDGEGVTYKYPTYVRHTNATEDHPEGDDCDKSIARACLGYAVTKIDGSDKQPLFAGQTTSVTVNGTTVSGNFYEIATPEDLITLAEALDDTEDPWKGADGKLFQQSNYIVTEDIDMDGQKIVPIHYYNLNGTEPCCFNGNGHTIKNFTANSVNQNEPNSCGLFGRSGGSHIIITNLNVENATYEFAHVGADGQKLVSTDVNPCSAVGGIYAVIDDEDIVIDNCTVTNIKMGSTNSTRAATTQTDFYAAGIVGLATRNVTIRNCKVGKATVDNTNDAASGKLVDQFGGAIGRIDIQDHPSDVITIENFTYDQSAVMVGSPAVFTPEQNTDPLTFDNGLKNVRYGGLIANITRGCTLYVKNCKVNHNAVLNTLIKDDGDGKATNIFVAGLIGTIKSEIMRAYIDAACEIHGTIENNSLASYTNDYEINLYISGDKKGNFKKLNETGSVDALEASHTTLSLTTSASKSTSFRYPSQTLFSTGTKSDSPTPKKTKRA